MAKKRKVTRSASKPKKSLYRAQTYGIKLDSMTFLVFTAFVLVVAIWLVAQMMDVRMF